MFYLVLPIYIIEVYKGLWRRTAEARVTYIRVFLRLLSLLWPEIMLAVIYLQNRTPIKSKKWKTPYELAFGKPPNISHLKIYGCRAYALRYGIPKTNKLKPRAKLGHLGVLPGPCTFRPRARFAFLPVTTAMEGYRR